MMADICRKVRRRSFTQIDNEPINDPNLKYEDLGLLLYVMSKPDNWVIYKNDLISSHQNGRESVNGILKRLETRGYLTVDQGRSEKGYFNHKQYIFTDRAFDFGDEYDPDIPGLIQGEPENYRPGTPCQAEVLSINGNPSTDNRQRETVNGNPTPYNTIYNNNAVVLDENTAQKIQSISKELLGQEMPESILKIFLGYPFEEIQTVIKTLQEKKAQKKIANPIGILLKDPTSVIRRILADEFYPDIVSAAGEMGEFEKHTGILLRGQAKQNQYQEWRKKFSREMVFKAGEVTALHSKNGSLDYMAAVLKDWEKKGITGPDQFYKKHNYGEIYSRPEEVRFLLPEQIEVK